MLKLLACDPNVRVLNIFHLVDEPSLAGWQSGLYWFAVPTPLAKQSAAVVSSWYRDDRRQLPGEAGSRGSLHPRAREPRNRSLTDRTCVRYGNEHMFAKSIILKTLALAAIALLVWSVAARPSGAHGPRVTYRVKAYDTLWTIANAHYGGDVRNAIWQIQQANHLNGTTISPGERLLLP